MNTAPPAAQVGNVLRQAIDATAYQHSNDAAKKPSNPRQSGLEKIEKIYWIADDIDNVLSLVFEVVGVYLASLSEVNQNSLASDCIALGVDVITEKIKAIRRTLDNTKEKSGAVRAHAILTRDKKLLEKHRKQSLLVSMRNNPGRELELTLKYIRDILQNPNERKQPPEDQLPTSAGALSISNDSEETETENVNPNDQSPSSPSKKRAKPNDTDEPEIRIPTPQNGRMYTHEEAVDVYMDAKENVVELCGTTNLNFHRIFLRKFKEEMVKRYLFIKISQLNSLIKSREENPSHRTVPQPGRPPLMKLDELLQMQVQHQQSHANIGWERSHTEATLIEAAKRKKLQKGLDPTTVDKVDPKTVDGYHNALATHPDNKVVTSKPNPIHRTVAALSQRPMLSNVAGMIAARCMHLSKDQVHHRVKLDLSNISDGVLRAREMYAKAINARPEDVYFTPKELMSNMDDKACEYTGDITKKFDMSHVIVNKSMLHKKYDVHDSRDNSNNFKGVKARYTSIMSAGGHLGPLFLQILGFTEAEMPNHRVIAIPVPGLAPNGDINPFVQTVGYLVLVRSGNKAEEEMFEKFEELVRIPFFDALKKQLGVDPENVETWATSVVTMDGGVPQMNATKKQASLNSKKRRNERLVKFSKNTSGVAQPCDTGNGHVRLGVHTKTMGADKTNYSPSTGVITVVEKKLQELRDSEDLVITSSKNDCIVGIASIYNSIASKSFDRKSIIQSFQVPGWLCSKQQGVDLDVAYNQYKGPRTIELREQWDRDLPVLIQDMLRHGRVLESTFDRLGYPNDMDQSGTEYPLSAAVITQHHRQRCTIMTNEELSEGFRLAEVGNIVSNESAEAAVAGEQNWRTDILEKNAIVEELILDSFGGEEIGDSIVDVIANVTTEDFIPDDMVKLFGRRGVPTDAFVRARCSTSQHDNSFKPPKSKGKADKVIEYLQKKSQNPFMELTADNDCWVLRAVQCCRQPVILSETIATEQVDEVAASNETEEQPLNILNPIAIVDNSPLLLEAYECFLGYTLQSDIDADTRKRIVVAVKLIARRFSFYKNHSLPNTREVRSHWTLAAYEENMHRCVEILGIANQINPRVETSTIRDSLLSPPHESIGLFLGVLEDENIRNMCGVSLYYDQHRSAFCHTVSTFGSGDSFAKQCKEDSRASKNPSTEFSRIYPDTEPKHSAPGSWNGLYTDLSLCLGLAIDPSSSNDCLTRTNGTGLFIWSERTMKKLDEMKAKQGTTLQAKQIRFILAMLRLTYELMMSNMHCISSEPLKPFMKGITNLRGGNDDDDNN